MTDYDLGRAHGTVSFDYDGDAVDRASRDVDRLGDKTSETSRTVQAENAAMQQAYNNLSTAVKSLSADVDRHAQAEVVAKSRVEAAEKALADVRGNTESTTKQIRDAEKALQQAQERSAESTRKTQVATEALRIARGKLAAIPSKRVAPNADQDSSALARLGAQLNAINANTHKSASGLNTFTGRTKLLAGAIAVATPAVAGLGVSLVALTGLAGVAAGALAAAGAAAATLAIGTSGIGDVFKAASADMKSAGASAASSAKQQRAAAQAIESAKRSLVDAEENLADVQKQASRDAIIAARAVLSAQRDLVNAQRDALRAQTSLTRARQEATRSLEDMRLALTGGALDERQAVLDVAKAQAELNAVLRDPTANESDRQQAILNLEKQQHALEQTRLENQRLTADQAEAARKGVEGSDAVVSAQDEVQSSTQRLADAQTALADAREAEKVQQEESARAIRDAVQGIADAQRQLQEAYADAAEAAVGGASKTADAMKNISPNARALVGEILDLQDEWQALKFSVQDRLFAGLADDVKPLANIYFPILREGAGAIADGFNAMIKNVVEFLKTGEAIDNIRQIFGNTGKAVGNLGTVARDLLAAFLDIAAVGSDFLPDMATGASNAAARFREFISAARESGKLKEWMQGGIDAASTLWQLIKNLGSIIGSVFTAFDQEGGGALNTLTALTGKIAEFLKTAEGQEALHALGRILASIGGAYGKVFLSFLDVAAKVLVELEPLITEFADAAGTYLAGALQVLSPVLEGIASVLGFLGPSLGPVIAGIYAANKAVDLAKIAWAALSVVMNANPFLVIAAAIVALALLIIQNWDSIVAALDAAWTWIQETAGAIWRRIVDNIVGPLTAAWEAIKNGWNAVVEFFKTVFSNIYNKVKETFFSILHNIQDTLTGMRDAVRNGLNNVIQFFKDLPGNILNWLKSLPGKMVNAGRDIVMGIVRGIGDFAHYIWDKITDAVSGAWDAVKDFFGISSPSKLMQWAGHMVGQGLADGIAGSVGMVTKAATSLAEAAAQPIPGMDPSTPSGLAYGSGYTGGTVVGMNLPQARAATTPAGATTNVYVQAVNQDIKGNLDPTNPVQWRRAMVNIKDGVRQLERDYA